MPYLIVEIDVTKPLPAISISENKTGVAIILRSKGRPIDFWMEALPPNYELSPEDLSVRISERIKLKLLGENISNELKPFRKAGQLPSLTVAICTKDRPELLIRCLKSLRATQYPDFGTLSFLEILVVDNASSDEATRVIVDLLPWVRYTCEPKTGLDFARNRALREATGELLAFLDDDVVVDRRWLVGLMEAWTENPDAVAYTGLVLPYELATEAQILFEKAGGFRRGFDKLRYHGQTLSNNLLYPCGAGMFGAGANMAFQREKLIELGGFDEALDTGRPLPGGGDLDIFYRVIRAGYPLVYEPQYMVFHQHRREIKALRRQYWSWGLGFMAFVDKSYHADPSNRSKFLRLILWWFKDRLRHLKGSLRGRNELATYMVLAELWGGIIGLLNEYSRSSRRIEHIRRQFACHS
jgi:glycosyltransferase involved in cell wall biosynthesis